jgi:hypothetical protein
LPGILGARQQRGLPTRPGKGDDLLPPEAYARHDESPDDQFYSFPRKVVRIDEGAIGALGRLYAERLPAGGRVLDLMRAGAAICPRTSAFCERQVRLQALRVFFIVVQRYRFQRSMAASSRSSARRSGFWHDQSRALSTRPTCAR